VLQDLEAAGAFVVPLDPARRGSATAGCSPGCCGWKLRPTAPGEVTGLHAGGGWLAAHGFGVEAVRHIQAAQDWELAGPAPGRAGRDRA